MNNQLTQYIKQLLNSGYDLKQIKDYLFQYGYSVDAVESAVKEVYHKPHVAFSKSTIAILTAVVAVIGLSIGVFLMSSVSKTPELLDVKVNVLTPDIKAGQVLTFNVDIFNMGGKQTYDVELRYEIYDFSNNMLAVKSESVALQTKLSSSATITIPPNTNPGNYLLSVKAYYNGQTASASSSFNVISTSCTPDCNDKVCGDNGCGGSCGNCNNSLNCENNQCVEEVVVPTPVVDKPPADDPVVDDTPADIPRTPNQQASDKLAEIKDLALSDINAAIQECRGYDTDSLTNVCLVSIADKANAFKPCSFISETSEKDQCYINYAMDTKDYTACKEVENSQLKAWCDGLNS